MSGSDEALRIEATKRDLAKLEEIMSLTRHGGDGVSRDDMDRWIAEIRRINERFS